MVIARGGQISERAVQPIPQADPARPVAVALGLHGRVVDAVHAGRREQQGQPLVPGGGSAQFEWWNRIESVKKRCQASSPPA